MQIPTGTSFMFVCCGHNTRLEGTPRLVHPNPEATAVWTFDISSMTCPEGGVSNSNCDILDWEARA